MTSRSGSTSNRRPEAGLLGAAFRARYTSRGSYLVWLPVASFSDDDLNALEAFAANLERATDLETLCWQVQEPVAHFDFPDCVFYVRNGNLLTQMSAHGPKRLPGNQIADRIALTMGQGIVGTVAATGVAQYVADTHADERYIEDVMVGRSEFAVPVVHRDLVIGVLDAEHPDQEGFTARHRQLLSAVADIVAPHLGALLERRNVGGSRSFGDIAAELARLPAIGSGNLNEALPFLTERAARALRVNRLNVWQIEDHGRVLKCLHHFELATSEHCQLDSLDLTEIPAYAHALTEERVVIANETLEDARTRGLREYLVTHDITAMLDAPIRVAGRTVGVICVEHTHTPRRWSVEEATFVATLADFVAMTLLHADKARTERALLHAQKLESLGRLAGGVAHDFNNLLTVLSGSVETLLQSGHLSDRDRQLVTLIGEAGQRAGKLTRQLLALGRRQHLHLVPARVCAIVETVAELLRRALPAGVHLETHASEDVWVSCDVSQIEQVLTNLVLNAADAMPQGGCVRIRTRSAHENDANVACIEVSDDGSGIAESDLEAIFEPFFSTKGERGSGLGLPVSQGIVHQHGGHIDVRSKLGEGTTFTVVIPAAEQPEEATQVQPEAMTLRAGEQAPVVVVEDEPGVRQVVSQMLDLLGVPARVAEDGDDALRLVRELRPTLMITDVIMPDVNGPELFSAAREIVPDLRVLFVSGYSQELLGNLPYDGDEFGFLGKPFTVRSLGDAIATLRETAAAG